MRANVNVKVHDLAEKLAAEHSLSEEEYAGLIDGRTGETASALAEEIIECNEQIS